MFHHFGHRGGFGGHHRLMHKLFGFGRHGWDHHEHGNRRGGRGRRMLDQGDLRFILLHLIAEKPSHGYELIKAVEEKFGGAYSPSPGVVYPTLTLLEEQGHIRVGATEGNKKLYEIMPEGTAALAAAEPTVAAVRERIAHAKACRQRESSPQIVRAVENFKMALRMRLSRGDLTTEQTQAIADIIDNAARSVERI